MSSWWKPFVVVAVLAVMLVSNLFGGQVPEVQAQIGTEGCSKTHEVLEIQPAGDGASDLKVKIIGVIYSHSGPTDFDISDVQANQNNGPLTAVFGWSMTNYKAVTVWPDSEGVYNFQKPLWEDWYSPYWVTFVPRTNGNPVILNRGDRNYHTYPREQREGSPEIKWLEIGDRGSLWDLYVIRRNLTPWVGNDENSVVAIMHNHQDESYRAQINVTSNMEDLTIVTSLDENFDEWNTSQCNENCEVLLPPYGYAYLKISGKAVVGRNWIVIRNVTNVEWDVSARPEKLYTYYLPIVPMSNTSSTCPVGNAPWPGPLVNPEATDLTVYADWVSLQYGSRTSIPPDPGPRPDFAAANMSCLITDPGLEQNNLLPNCNFAGNVDGWDGGQYEANKSLDIGTGSLKAIRMVTRQITAPKTGSYSAYFYMKPEGYMFICSPAKYWCKEVNIRNFYGSWDSGGFTVDNIQAGEVLTVGFRPIQEGPVPNVAPLPSAMEE